MEQSKERAAIVNFLSHYKGATAARANLVAQWYPFHDYQENNITLSASLLQRALMFMYREWGIAATEAELLEAFKHLEGWLNECVRDCDCSVKLIVNEEQELDDLLWEIEVPLDEPLNEPYEDVSTGNLIEEDFEDYFRVSAHIINYNPEGIEELEVFLSEAAVTDNKDNKALKQERIKYHAKRFLESQDYNDELVEEALEAIRFDESQRPYIGTATLDDTLTSKLGIVVRDLSCFMTHKRYVPIDEILGEEV